MQFVHLQPTTFENSQIKNNVLWRICFVTDIGLVL